MIDPQQKKIDYIKSMTDKQIKILAEAAAAKIMKMRHCSMWGKENKRYDD